MTQKKVSMLSQMKILLKKNALLYMRSPATIFMELFIPIYVCFWLWAIKYNFDPNLVDIPKLLPSNPENMIDV